MSSKAIQERSAATKPAAKSMVFDAASPQFRELGICSTCNHRASCLFLRSARHPIAFCEEFDGTANDAVQKPAIKPKALAKVNFGQAQEEGVCVTCTNRTSCVYRQPGLAIWDCEDFS